MGRRSKTKKRKTPPPNGLSRYAMKVRGLLPSNNQSEAPSSKQPPAPDWTKPAEAGSLLKKHTRTLPPGTELVTAKVSGIYLRTGGYVFLMDNRKRRIYLSDGVLEKFDAQFSIENGSLVECAVIHEERGPRAVEIYDIQSPR